VAVRLPTRPGRVGRARRNRPAGAARIRTDEDIEAAWARIRSQAREEFHTKTGLPFRYEVPGNYLLVDRANRSLSKTNFRKALDALPADGPGDIKDRQGSAYTWAILMDPRIRLQDW
jgi:hypothetical protein